MKKIMLTLLALTMTLSVQAKSFKGEFSNVIKESGVDSQAINVSIKNADSGKVICKLNEKTPVHPASVQKLLTMPAAAEILGNDYKFSTKIYSRGENDYIIQLGADPYLTSKDLKSLTSTVKIGANNIYIDSSIMDNKTWGEGWQWDDDLNTSMPRFGAYNLDKNIASLTVIPSVNSGIATVTNKSKYPFIIFNNITTSDTTNIKVSRDISASPNKLVLDGTVSRTTTLNIPINNIQLYFNIRLKNALENHKVYLKEDFRPSSVKESDIRLLTINHDLDTALDDILKNSNNLAAETVFKLAGGKYLNEAGSDVDGIKVFNDYCLKNKLDNSGIKIVDGSGVSKNNLVSADFVTDFLILNKKNPVLDKLPHPGEGTLTLRMLPIRDNLRAKTGTLADISSIAGYLTSRSGKKYVFCIMINDTKLSSSDKKMLEDYIIKEAYLRL